MKKVKAIGTILAVMLLVITAAMGVMAVSMVGSSLAGSTNYLSSQQALYSAESGINYAIVKIKTDAAFRSAPYTLTGSIGKGDFSVDVAKAGSDYTITSTGTSGDSERQVARAITTTTTTSLPAAFDYAMALFSPSALTIKGAASVSGSIYYSGTNALRINNPATVSGYAYASNLGGTGTYLTPSVMPNPLPTYPTLDTSTYDNYITLGTGGLATSPLTLNGGTYNVSGTVYVTNLSVSSSAVITGSGTIVVTGTTSINTSSIASTVTVAANNSISFGGTVTGGAVYYSKTGGVSLTGGTDVTGNVLTPASFTTGVGTSSITGLVYANSFTLNGTPTIRGSIVANGYGSSQINGTVNIIYDQPSLPATVPTGLTGTTTVNVSSQTWTEQ